MAEQVVILPQRWVEDYEPMVPGWFEEHAPGLLRKVPDFTRWVREICENVRVSWRILPVRIEIEQSAISYAWDGTTRHYEGGLRGEETKLRYLCGVDKTDSGPRTNGWFGPRRQMLGCVLRFKYWYRGIKPRGDWGNWLGLEEDPHFKPGVAVTRGGKTIVPANQISADCLRYTTNIEAQYSLNAVARRWFPEDFEDQTDPLGFGMASVTKVSGTSVTGNVVSFDGGAVHVDLGGVELAIPFSEVCSILRILW